MLGRAARRNLLGQPVGIVVVEAVGGDARRVTDPLRAGFRRLLEHPSRAATLSSRVASLALRIANARCTTTSASFTSPRTLSTSVTSPWRYSVLRQPRSAGSNGPPRHTHDPLHRPRALQGVDDGRGRGRPLGRSPPPSGRCSSCAVLPDGLRRKRRWASVTGSPRTRAARRSRRRRQCPAPHRSARDRARRRATAHPSSPRPVSIESAAAAGDPIGERARADAVAPAAAVDLDGATARGHHVRAGAAEIVDVALSELMRSAPDPASTKSPPRLA